MYFPHVLQRLSKTAIIAILTIFALLHLAEAVIGYGHGRNSDETQEEACLEEGTKKVHFTHNTQSIPPYRAVLSPESLG